VGGDVFYVAQILNGVRSEVDTLQSPSANFQGAVSLTGQSVSAIGIEVVGPMPAGINNNLVLQGAVDASGMVAPLQVGSYVGGITFDFGIGCAVPYGRFTITSLLATPGEIVDLTVAFEMKCSQWPELYFGCVHVEGLSLGLGP
jgi:hypothetical protein